MDPLVQTRCYIGLGSNLDDPESQLHQACRAIEALPNTNAPRCSPLYSNPPMGPADQPDFVNCVLEVHCITPPQALLQQLLAIEQQQGRTRSSDNSNHWGPRLIDLDLLLYGEQQLNTDALTVPHPGIQLRNFVLQPLFDLNPGLIIPGQGPLQPLLDRCPNHQLIKL